ncbi:MAG TPA: hypothetical protein VMQ76_06910 [Terracidiphilus sp.]|nr:hypothetical protein [Terracidiphilus sp.]
MLTYQIVIEADNVARYVIQHNDLLVKTYAGPQVGVLSQGYINDYKDQFSLPDIPAVLANMGVTNALTPDQLNGLV